ncbi:MAG TPA: hypothetical protein VFM59_07020, partial [Salinimicrobium sp.]|nr:hypothetical protein [Salinimicrobium sp.]
MTTMKITALKPFCLLLLLSAGSIFGQTKQKFKKSYPVNKEVAVSVDATHTNLVFETWDKNEVEITGFVNSKDLPDEEVKKLLENWKVKVSSDKAQLKISSAGELSNGFEIAGLDSIVMMTSEMMAPLMNNLVGPLLESISDNPLPPEFYESVSGLEFDHEAYERDGEKYMEKWEKQLDKKFGKNFEKAMEEWGKKFEKDAEKWGKEVEIEMEINGEQLEKDMEKWAASFEKDMEAWGEEFGKKMEVWGQQFENSENGVHPKMPILNLNSTGKSKRNLLIKMPKDANLKLEVRFGEVKLAENTNNLKADLSHSKLTAEKISGKNTRIIASYTPVLVKRWDYGILNTSYVENCQIDSAESLKLSSNSSNVNIGKIEKIGIISGTFGKLEIKNLAPDFELLDISLENTDLDLNLPETALIFNYNGSQSDIS